MAMAVTMAHQFGIERVAVPTAGNAGTPSRSSSLNVRTMTFFDFGRRFSSMGSCVRLEDTNGTSTASEISFCQFAQNPQFAAIARTPWASRSLAAAMNLERSSSDERPTTNASTSMSSTCR